jgi:hypothetical protein
VKDVNSDMINIKQTELRTTEVPISDPSDPQIEIVIGVEKV